MAGTRLAPTGSILAYLVEAVETATSLVFSGFRSAQRRNRTADTGIFNPSRRAGFVRRTRARTPRRARSGTRLAPTAGLAAVTAALAACSPTSAVDEPCTTAARWHGDETFTRAEQREIEVAEAWLSARFGEEPHGIAWDLPHDAPPAPWGISRAAGPNGETGYSVSWHVWISPDASAGEPVRLEWVAALAAHEMAHVRGFVDDADSDGLMHRIDALKWTAREEDQRVRVTGR